MPGGPEFGGRPTAADLAENVLLAPREEEQQPEPNRETERRQNIPLSTQLFVRGQHWLRTLAEPVTQRRLEPVLRIFLHLGILAGPALPGLSDLASTTATWLGHLAKVSGVKTFDPTPMTPMLLAEGAKGDILDLRPEGALDPKAWVESMIQLGCDLKTVSEILSGALDHLVAEVQDFGLNTDVMTEAMAIFGVEAPQLQPAHA